MTGKRGKKLTPGRIKEIVQIIDNLSGEISWQKVVESVERTLLIRYTRQALSGHKGIQDAFVAARLKLTLKEAASSAGRRARSDARVERYRADNHRLEKENARLINQHIIWLYNANLYGLGEEQLNMPIPPVNRGQTRR